MKREHTRPVRRRFRMLRAWMATPEDAWLLVRILAWAAFLPVLKRLLRLEALAKLVWTESRATGRQTDREEQIVRLGHWLYGLGGVTNHGRCLERSLLLYRFLAMGRANPILVIGVQKARTSWVGHAWITVDGQPVGEPPASLQAYVPVLSFGAGGRRQSLAMAHVPLAQEGVVTGVPDHFSTPAAGD